MRRLVAVLLGAVLLMGAIAIVTAAEVNKGAATYTIDKCKERKSAVTFHHYQHQNIQGVTCKTCHHKMVEGKTPRACFECHQCKKQGKIPSARMAFHKNCRGCHRTMKKEGKKTGPTTCSGCHPKQK